MHASWINLGADVAELLAGGLAFLYGCRGLPREWAGSENIGVVFCRGPTVGTDRCTEGIPLIVLNWHGPP